MQPLINEVPFMTMPYFLAGAAKVGHSFRFPYVHKRVFKAFMKLHYSKIEESEFSEVMLKAEQAKDTYDVMSIYTDYIMELDAKREFI